jgi:hypothetical protein
MLRREPNAVVAAADDVAPPKPRSFWARALRLLGQLAMLLALAFLLGRLHGQLSELRPLSLDARVVFHIALAFAVCFAIFLAETINWGLLLGGSDPHRFKRVGVVFAYTQVAKYLPGNVLQYVLGVQVGSRIGVPVTQMVTVLIRATLISIAVASLLGLFALNDAERAVREALRVAQRPRPWVLAGLALAALLVALVFALVLRRTSVWDKLMASLRNLPPRAAAAVVSINVLEFTGYGVCAWQVALLWAHADTVVPSPWGFTCGFALAWVAGLVIPGAPGGLGVRETILYALFAPTLGGTLAVATFIGMRVVLVLAELLFFLPAPFLLRRYEQELALSPERD